MASRKPNLRIPLPEAEQGDFQRPTSSLRSPRFIEDFNAPFSEALMNASRTTLATDTYPSTSTNGRTSFGGESGGRPSLSPRQSGLQSPTPLRLRHSSWESETKRRSTVNDRVREWARKSWGAVRNRSESKGGYFDTNPSHSRSTAVLSPSPGDTSPSECDGPVRSATFSQAVVTFNQVPPSRSR
ncbi:hypothetical protein G7Z17_g5611 [Cylindrodendrum hubeiense]|uniref:Uncharacterized protein n=1 Tax=Cylindrodendrum hubeiense TaxID=595255 RepID=A0A9P5HEL5_9HYPO|nr:hypothetical protein G7Z17_g5611 [Cylindrodendrum hubeiense]